MLTGELEKRERSSEQALAADVCGWVEVVKRRRRMQDIVRRLMFSGVS